MELENPTGFSLTLLAAAPLVLDDVLVVQGLEDLDFPLPGAQELGAAPGFQGFHRHHLPGAVVGGVVAAQAHLPKVALQGIFLGGFGHGKEVSGFPCAGRIQRGQ